jgi:hypothetical protein
MLIMNPASVYPFDSLSGGESKEACLSGKPKVLRQLAEIQGVRCRDKDSFIHRNF